MGPASERTDWQTDMTEHITIPQRLWRIVKRAFFSNQFRDTCLGLTTNFEKFNLQTFFITVLNFLKKLGVHDRYVIL